MIIPTHKIIGSYIYESVITHTDIKLNKKNLIIGSMLPDLSPKYIKQKHFYHVSYDYILNMIEELYNDSNNINMKEFSLRLGIITHYISDFFCTPHNNRQYYHNHIKEHMQFETKLHFLFAKKKLIDILNIPDISSINYNNIKLILDELREDYILEGTSYENDLKSSLNAVTIISSLLAYHCFKTYNIPAFAS